MNYKILNYFFALEEQEAGIKLFNDYLLIASEAKYKAIHGKGRPSDSTSCLKILSPKQILQRISVAPAQVKGGNKPENC